MPTVNRLVVGITPGDAPQIATDPTRIYWGEAGVLSSSHTVSAGWGRNLGGTLGNGWDLLFQATPLGMEIRDAQQLAVGYAEMVAVMPDRSLLCWGTSNSLVIPDQVGPDFQYSGMWEYRTGLVAQVHWETVNGWSPPIIREKERKKELPFYEAKEKGTSGPLHVYANNGVSIGQMVYPVGAYCFWVGKTWQALKENVGVEPGTDATVWEIAPTQFQVNQYLNHIKERYEPFSHNRGLPTTAPYLESGVVQAVWGGQHGVALKEDGTVVSWGYIKMGTMGDGIDKSWGPKPRPILARPNVKYRINAAIALGSTQMTSTTNIHPPHEAGGEVSPSQVKKGALLEELFDSVAKVPLSLATYFPSFTATVTMNSPIMTAVSSTAGLRVGQPVLGPGLPSGVATPNVARIGPATGLAANEVELTAPAKTSSTGTTYIPGVEIVSYNETTHEITLTVAALKALPSTTNWWFRNLGKEAGFWQYEPYNNAAWPVKADLTAAGTAKVVAVAAATNPGAMPISAALLDSGEVLVWGSNIYGCLGDLGTTGIEHMALKPQKVKEPGGANLKNIKAIACGETFIMALTNDGKIWIWGKVEEGQAGKKPIEEKKKTTSTPLLMEGIPTTAGELPVAIAAGLHTCYAVLEDGTMLAWGGNEQGELGNGTVAGPKSTTNKEPWNTTPTRVKAPGGSNLKNIVGAVGGRQHVAALGSGGKLWVWGGNEWGQIGDGTRAKDGSASKPTPIEIYTSGVISVSAGEFNTIAILEGSESPPITLRVRLVPAGEFSGEVKAFVRLRWRSPQKTGWSLKFLAKKTLQEESEREALKEELEVIIANESGEFTGEEITEAKEELEALEQREEELAAKGTLLNITPTEISPGVYEYLWEPPGPVTEQLGYSLKLEQGVSWKGNLVAASNRMSSISAATGVIEPGFSVVGKGVPTGTKVLRVGPAEGLAANELELSEPAIANNTGQTYSGTNWEVLTILTDYLWGSPLYSFGSFSEGPPGGSLLSEVHLNGTVPNLHFQSPASSAVATDSEHLYYVSSIGSSMKIGRCLLDGTSPEPEWADASVAGHGEGKITSLCRSGEWLYWLASFEKWSENKPRPVVGRIKISGTGAEPTWKLLRMGITGSSLLQGFLTTDGTNLYVGGQAHGGEAEVSGANDSEYVARITPGGEVNYRWMKPDRAPVSGIFADSEFFYWRSWAGVGRIGLDLTERKNTWLELPGWEPQAISIRGGFAYWIDPGSSSVNRAAIPEETAPPLEETTEEAGSTFTLLPEIDPNIKGSFSYGHDRKLYRIASHLENGIIKGVTDESIRQGLRDLGIFRES